MIGHVVAHDSHLRFIAIYEDSNHDGGMLVSYAGGGEFLINGIGLNEAPKSNQVQFTTDSLSTSAITVTGTDLTGKSSKI